MPVDKELLEILCCPVTRVPLRLASPELVARINERVRAGALKYQNGATVKDELQEALLTTDGLRIYAVRDDIPIMLADESIPVDQFDEELKQAILHEATAAGAEPSST